ncbi:HD domain-containing phosphohydrolase [Candidatus Omnitrophota bacterium]
MSLQDRNMNIVWINDIHASWFGSLQKIKGRKCYEVYEKRSQVCRNCPVKKVFEANQDVCVRVRPGITKNGEKRYYRIFAKPVRNENNEVLFALELVQDITAERKKLDDLKTKVRFMHSEVASIEKITENFAARFELDKTIKSVLSTTKNLLHADGCCVHLLDEKRGSFILKEKDAPNCLSDKEHRELCRNLSNHVVLTRKPATFEGACSFLSVPISFGKNVVGVISIFNKRPYRFNSDEKCLLMTFANQSAIIIGNEKLYRKLHLSYLNTIRALVSIIEAKDPYTRGHSEKVTSYAIRIARALKLKKGCRRILSYCGRLHDIGKIAVSDNILNKPGPLTNHEFVQVTKHPSKGAEILRHLEFLKDGVLAIKHHHERYDGKGYPDGLKGAKIPLLARILTIADSYDAMTSDRAYRKSLSREMSIEQLKSCSGKQFDPKMVDAFLCSIA